MLMLIEGCIFGVILLLILNDFSIFQLTNSSYEESLLLNLYLSIGAGIWEEILFRLILFSLLCKFISFLVNRLYYIDIIASIIISSIIFSLFHYIGPYGDSFVINTFLIRFIGGIFLCSIYYFRGFGISSVAHISYDFILVSLPVIYYS